ncbi:Type II restriction enzyme [Helicobacter sp. NHP19-012]|uniref:Type-2 restriction enzyme n=1 Tax=Helicobacter gastrofelis TaxID=2849642 RepID=A0ABM7SF27_9HELI|nr:MULTISPECIES: type II restriction endonuclease [unclassified Helicobacter]BCZ19415.1 Type II restriction enzyme [Helicobacter sp. NHP19-012]GMB96406.1 Type II restriction enzyme [Helicobacter sp. NHP22-001]
MTNPTPFTEFLATLQKTNRTLDFFVDWQKCLENRKKTRLYATHLNALLGVSALDLPAKVAQLFKDNQEAFSLLPLLLAIRNPKELVKQGTLQDYLQSPKGICTLLHESGLFEILSTHKVKDLNDLILGIEVGLDSNARKNRSGALMEQYLEHAFKEAKLNFKTQVSVTEFKDLHASFGNDIKKFDFVIYGAQTTYFIECNFYSSGGSKLNEVARAYLELAPRFAKHPHKEFIWITDGQGWLEAKNKLQEAYKSVRVYNLSQLDTLLRELNHA